jgi:CRP-like cAMP-binding protein
LKLECVHCPVLGSELFKSLSKEQLLKMDCIFRSNYYRRNQILFFEGGKAQHVFALSKGLVKMVKSLESGKERIARVIFPGEFFGLEGLTETNYTLSAVVLQDSEICAIFRDEFFDFLRAHPDISLDMIRVLVGELQRVGGQVTDMSFKDARARMATFLLSLRSSAPEDSANGSSVTLPLSSQEIGDVLELSPETVSRTWGVLRREGLADKQGRRVLIQNLSGLEAASRR